MYLKGIRPTADNQARRYGDIGISTVENIINPFEFDFSNLAVLCSGAVSNEAVKDDLLTAKMMGGILCF